jgi:phosphatidylglycerophosphatase A
MIIATVGFLGYVPVAPGTAGSLAALLLYVPLRSAATAPVFVAVMAVLLVAGWWASNEAERALQRKDPGPVVVDEVFGMLVTLAWLPLSWTGVFAGFLLFRVFDVVKPFPVRRLERLPGGAGIMADDTAAGVYAHVFLRVAAALWPSWILA